MALLGGVDPRRRCPFIEGEAVMVTLRSNDAIDRTRSSRLLKKEFE
jgi:hypothetical protein